MKPKTVRPVVCRNSILTAKSGNGAIAYIKLIITTEKTDDWVELIIKEKITKKTLFHHRALVSSTETFFDFSGGHLKFHDGFFTAKAKNCKPIYYT